jgi:GMP synthase (glutamine-hydrolysing)
MTAPTSAPIAPTISPMTDTVLNIDFGSQVTQLIARRVREQGVYSEIVPFNRAQDALERLKPKAVILSGGPASVTEFGTPRAPDWVFRAGLPVLGICYGEQTMVAQMGGGTIGSSGAPSWRLPPIRPCSRVYGERARPTRCG